MLIGRKFMEGAVIIDPSANIPSNRSAKRPPPLNRTHLYVLAFILAAIGLGLFLYKVLALHFPLSPEAESYTWNVEAKITFTAGNEPVKLALFTPRTTRRYAITNEAFVSRGMGSSPPWRTPNRQATWSIRQASGLQTLYYRAEVVRVNSREPINPIQPPTIDNPSFERRRPDRGARPGGPHPPAFRRP